MNEQSLADLIGKPVQLHLYGWIVAGVLDKNGDSYYVGEGDDRDALLNSFTEDEIDVVVVAEDGTYKIITKEWIEWTLKRES